MKLLFGVVLSLTLILGQAASASEQSLQLTDCIQELESVPAPIKTPQSRVDRFKSYSQEVRDTKGLRLILKDPNPVSNPHRWGGLLTYHEPKYKKGISGYLSSILGYVPRQVRSLLWNDPSYRFTPIDATYEAVLRRPVKKISQFVTGRVKEPTKLVQFSFVMALSMFMYNQGEHVYSHILHHRVTSQIANYTNEYDSQISSDFRYDKIRSQLKNKEISPAEARQQAYDVSLAYTQYYSYRDANADAQSLNDEMKLLNHYLFVHLKNIIVHGVQPAVGFDVPQESVGPLSDAQKLQLFEVNHLLYLKYEIIAEMVKGNTDLGAGATNQDFNEIVNEIKNDPFNLSLLNLYNQHKISKDQYKYLVQQNSYWQTKFLEWRIVKINKLKKVNGQYTSTPLTLADIQHEMLDSVSVLEGTRP